MNNWDMLIPNQPIVFIGRNVSPNIVIQIMQCILGDTKHIALTLGSGTEIVLPVNNARRPMTDRIMEMLSCLDDHLDNITPQDMDHLGTYSHRDEMFNLYKGKYLGPYHSIFTYYMVLPGHSTHK